MSISVAMEVSLILGSSPVLVFVVVWVSVEVLVIFGFAKVFIHLWGCLLKFCILWL